VYLWVRILVGLSKINKGKIPKKIGDMSCDFEDSSICGYDIGDKFVWQEGFVHYLPSIDHTYGNESGMCMDFTDFMIVDFFSILIRFDKMKNKKYQCR
jgi:hypothetical protein